MIYYDSFRLEVWKKRRLQYDASFVHKVICGGVDSTYLLGCFPLHVCTIHNYIPQRRTRAGPSQLLHVPIAHEANMETIRRGLFRRAVWASNEHVSRFEAADQFRAALASFNPRPCRGGGCDPPMSFSGMASEPLVGSR